MKKKFVFCLTAAVLFCMAACTKPASGDADPTKKPKVTEEPEFTATPEPTKEPEATATPEPTEAPEVTATPEPTKQVAVDDAKNQIPVATWKGYANEAEDGQIIAYVEYGQIGLTEEGQKTYPQLAGALQEYSDVEMDVRTQYLQMLANSASVDLHDGMLQTAYFISTDIKVLRADAKVLSFVVNYSDYTGGAHGYHAKGGCNFNPQTGAEYKLGDIVVDMEVTKQKLAAAILEKYSEEVMFDVTEYLNENFQEDDAELSWVLDYNGLTFYFAPYEIAAYAYGVLDITFPYSDTEVIRPEFAGLPESYVYEIGAYEQAEPDFLGNGEKTTAFVSAYEEDFFYYVSVNLDGTEHKIDEECWEYNIFVVHTKGGKEYLYVETRCYATWAQLYVFGEKDGKLGLIGVYGCNGFAQAVPDGVGTGTGTQAFTNPEQFYLTRIVDAVGTRSTKASYHVGADGMPVRDSDGYDVEIRWSNRVKADFEAVTVKTGETKTIPAGSAAYVIRTDGETFVIVEVDGVEYRLDMDNSDWPHTINGQDENELFEDVNYAG